MSFIWYHNISLNLNYFLINIFPMSSTKQRPLYLNIKFSFILMLPKSVLFTTWCIVRSMPVLSTLYVLHALCMYIVTIYVNLKRTFSFVLWRSIFEFEILLKFLPSSLQVAVIMLNKYLSKFKSIWNYCSWI